MTHNPLDYLTMAVRDVLRNGDHTWSWTFFHCMDETAKLKFDEFLLRTKDPLAFEAGTCERRFKTRVLAMANTERARLAAKEPQHECPKCHEVLQPLGSGIAHYCEAQVSDEKADNKI